MIEEETKVGLKGQVVIPRVFRSALKINPGSKDAAAEFERIAKGGKSISRIPPHTYKEEIVKRSLGGDPILIFSQFGL